MHIKHYRKAWSFRSTRFPPLVAHAQQSSSVWAETQSTSSFGIIAHTGRRWAESQCVLLHHASNAPNTAHTRMYIHAYVYLYITSLIFTSFIFSFLTLSPSYPRRAILSRYKCIYT